ncbi:MULTISPECIES: hypothetical protein [unclassified Streptomyces]|uniref:hypothetical protein n=1 Tax=unclassified Streptomyces TaxID=2593676 RepID=UPI00036ACA1E|nr:MULTISPECIES: hypothetical protein [unclassified Streptomyces]
MLFVAVLLLPLMGLLLYGMDRLEDRVVRPEGRTGDHLTEHQKGARPRRHAQRRHLRLIHGGGRKASGRHRDQQSPAAGADADTGADHAETA